MLKSPRYRAPVPVLCIGNFVVGGAGKTPTALAVAALAASEGLVPGFLTRGYGGTSAGPLAVDLDRHNPDLVGDEALLLARRAPTVVARQRHLGVEPLIDAGVTILIMDDGMQNPVLAKDLSLAVIDAAAGLGNGQILPAGPLRAPIAAQFARTDALVVVGAGSAADRVIREAERAAKPVLIAALRPRAPAPRQRRLLAFAGIGRPEKFFATLRDSGGEIADAIPFPDHHKYSARDAEGLLRRADAEDLQLITTEKDASRLGGREGVLAALAARAVPFAVDLVFADPAAASALLRAVPKAR